MTSYSEYLNGAEHDLEPYAGWPEIRYAIVGSPRTGTNLLSDYLNQLGLGAPMEYFSRYSIEVLPPRLGAWTPADYANVLMSRRTSSIIGFDGKPTTAVFGVKTLWPYEWQRVQAFIWPNRIIRMFREEKEDQIKSYARARVSDVWAVMQGDDYDATSDQPELEPEALVDAENIIMKLEQFWNGAAESNVAFSYEYLVAEPVDTLQHIIDEVFELDVTVPDDITARTRKLAT